MAERHPEQDVLVDLALGEVDGPEQDVLARHLATCDDCRADYAAVAVGLEHVLAAAPRTPPPPGFDARALAAMGLAERSSHGRSGPTAHGGPERASHGRSGPTAHGGPERGSHGRGGAPGRGPAAADRGGPSVPGRGRRRRTLLLVGAAAVLGIAVGAGAATVLDVSRDEASVVSSGTALRTADGDVVGRVSTGVQEGEEVLVVDITGAREGATYDCRVLLDDGDPLHAGRWTLRAGGPTVWVVPAPEGASGVELVTDAGTVWSEASL